MTGHAPHLTPAATRRLTVDAEPWMSCDDCFEEIDDHIERLLDGDSHISPRMRAHLIGCTACFEDAWSLLLLASDDRGIDRREALGRLRDELGSEALDWPDLSTVTLHGSDHDGQA